MGTGAPAQLSDEHWDLLLSRIYRSECVPFLGAAVNIKSDGYAGLPLGAEVALSLLARDLKISGKELCMETFVDVHTKHPAFEKSGKFADLARCVLSDLPRVALYYRGQRDTKFITDTLLDLLPDHQLSPSPTLRDLAALVYPAKDLRGGFTTIVTTNYDCLLEHAIDKRVVYERVIQPPDGFSSKQMRAVQARLEIKTLPVIYKIHGSFPATRDARERREQSVDCWPAVTEEDYINLLTVLQDRRRGVPPLLLGRIASSTLLFLGYSLQDIDIRTVYKGLIEPLPVSRQRTSIAIQRNPSPFWVEFWRYKNVHVYDMDVHQFSKELCSRYRDYVTDIDHG